MTKRSKTVSKLGYPSNVPAKTTVTFKGGKGGGGGGGRGEGSYQTKSRVSYGDKQTGSYGRATTKERVSTGEFHYKNGQNGTKSEYKKSSTLRVGHKSGYTEISTEQTVRNVTYNNRSNNLITYENDAYGSDSGYGSGFATDYGYCSDYGSAYSYGYGYSYGSGYAPDYGYGSDYGSGSAPDYGYGSGSAPDYAYGSDYGSAPDYGSGSSDPDY